MKKREFLGLCAASIGWGSSPLTAASTPKSVTLACAGAEIAGGSVRAYWAGLMQPDWAGGAMLRTASTPVPTRAHGLAAMPDGGFVAVATRPGRWLLRCDAQARVQCMLDTSTTVRSFEGHVVVSADGQWLYTTETDPRTGQGWVSVRDVRTLRSVSEFRTGGSEPHQLLLDSSGALLVANGGVLRDANDRKVDIHRMDSSLVHLQPHTRERLGQWRLGDRRLGLRHMAWGHAVQGHSPLLGIALQNEHDDPEQRRNSPLLAVWDGSDLRVPAAQATGAGYAGDIAAAQDGGFVLSSQRAGKVFRWTPQRPETLEPLLVLKEAGALTSMDGEVEGADVLVAGALTALGVGRREELLAWPDGLQVDNHWVPVVAV